MINLTGVTGNSPTWCRAHVPTTMCYYRRLGGYSACGNAGALNSILTNRGVGVRRKLYNVGKINAGVVGRCAIAGTTGLVVGQLVPSTGRFNHQSI